MKRTRSFLLLSIGSAALAASALLPGARGAPPPVAGWKIVGWNDLGMHCMDPDYAVFSILPPFNDVVAHVVDDQGDLVTDPTGLVVTYRAVSDPTGSINTTSANKTNFWDHVADLFGVSLAVDQGLAGHDMPGAGNTPQPMDFDAARNWFVAPGVPIAPLDNAMHDQNYPLMRLEARTTGGVLLASTDVVLPISDEMDCRICHSSGAGDAAKPAQGWAMDPDPVRDYRRNILLLHDQLQGMNRRYVVALDQLGYDPAGLHATAINDGHAVLCASCHPSNALPGTGIAGISPLTAAVHGGHANVIDPISHTVMDDLDNRSSCYRCHPGSETRCLRGAMGAAVAPDGSLAMQCQDCHGNMSRVGDATRVGWLEQPACQSCHTGTAVQNNGQIRYTSVFDGTGVPRVAVNATYATDPDQPAPGFDLYRFSDGHGGLSCEACHGSTHAIFPSTHANDNIQSIALQGHEGMLSECSACHDPVPDTVTGGPHGLHPLGQTWIEGHKDAAEHGGSAQCRACHGTDYRGTVLSRSQADRTLSTDFGTKHFWRGFQVGCYDCHQGPSNENPNPNHAPVVQNAQATTPAGVPVDLVLVASDADSNPLALRIVKQAQHGTVALNGTSATYHPEPGFAGTDQFRFAARDGSTDSNLGVATLTVTANWENYGEGWPGTNGVPVLVANAVPSLGTNVPIHMGNSRGTTTVGFVYVGTRPDYQPTVFGGTYLVRDPSFRTFQIGPNGLTRGFHVPSNANTIGRNLLLQLVEMDPGASHGLSFSAGLRLVMGL